MATNPGTWRFLFYPPRDYEYFAHRAAHPFEPAAPGFRLPNAAWAADAAMLAYARNGETPIGWDGVDRILRDAGFTDRRPLGDWGTLGTQAYLARRDAWAVLSFRGTERKDWTDTLRNLALVPSLEDWRQGVLVHSGFQGALDSIWDDVAAAIPVDVPLLITGHSLGGALGSIAAGRLNRPMHHYTFGSPRAGNGAFVSRVMEETGGRMFRMVNEGDLVTTVPPASLFFQHVPEREWRIGPDGSIAESEPGAALTIEDTLLALGAAARFFAGGQNLDDPVPHARLADHSPGRYLRRIRAGL